MHWNSNEKVLCPHCKEISYITLGLCDSCEQYVAEENIKQSVAQEQIEHNVVENEN